MSATDDDLDRHEPDGTADERTMLAQWLDYHRATLERKCEGLTDAQLRRRAVPPSDMSLLGLVRHLADVERHWMRRVLAEEDVASLFDDDEEWSGVDSADTGTAFEVWRGETEQSRRVLAGVPSLDTTREYSATGETLSARWVLTHLVEEYARHNGHADLLRERIDGAVGD